MAYTLTLTAADIQAIDFAGYRYYWSDVLREFGVVEGDNVLAEHQAWDLQGYINEDTQELRTDIPLASASLQRKLLDFCDRIV